VLITERPRPTEDLSASKARSIQPLGPRRPRAGPRG
jgi:hypothetical protein